MDLDLWLTVAVATTTTTTTTIVASTNSLCIIELPTKASTVIAYMYGKRLPVLSLSLLPGQLAHEITFLSSQGPKKRVHTVALLSAASVPQAICIALCCLLHLSRYTFQGKWLIANL